MNRVVGPLEQALFAVLHEFQRQIFVRAFRQIFQRAAGTTVEAVMSSSICTFTAG
jgi:hypothetical protein